MNGDYDCDGNWTLLLAVWAAGSNTVIQICVLLASCTVIISQSCSKEHLPTARSCSAWFNCHKHFMNTLQTVVHSTVFGLARGASTPVLGPRQSCPLKKLWCPTCAPSRTNAWRRHCFFVALYHTIIWNGERRSRRSVEPACAYVLMHMRVFNTHLREFLQTHILW